MQSHIEMSARDWIKVEDNPIQRDTKRHAAKAKHLLVARAPHAIVFAAQLPSKKLVKLDGHTRAYMWANDMAPVPNSVTVNIIPVKDLEEAVELYKTFDSRDALETTTDKVSGAFHKFDFIPASELINGGAISNAMRVAQSIMAGRKGTTTTRGWSRQKGGAMDIYGLIEDFLPELAALDSLNLTRAHWKGGIISAFLISHRRYGNKVMPFWRALRDKKGSKVDGDMDGVQALLEYILTIRGDFGGAATADQCSRAMNCVERWMLDKTFKNLPRPMDMSAYTDTKSAFALVKKGKGERLQAVKGKKEQAEPDPDLPAHVTGGNAYA